MSTLHERIYISRKEIDLYYSDMGRTIDLLIKEAANNKEAIIKLLGELIPEYHNPVYQTQTPAKVIPMSSRDMKSASR